jgi:hypothetical protein
MRTLYLPVAVLSSRRATSVQTWSAPPRNHDWMAACITLG